MFDPAVFRHLLGFDHLALRRRLVVHAVQDVAHQCRGIANDRIGVPDWIEIAEIVLRRARNAQRRKGAAYGRR
jgi:hypothetical protein